LKYNESPISNEIPISDLKNGVSRHIARCHGGRYTFDDPERSFKDENILHERDHREIFLCVNGKYPHLKGICESVRPHTHP